MSTMRLRVLALIGGAAALGALAALGGCDVDSGAPATRQEQIEERWAQLGPSYAGQYYLSADQPSWSNPYNAGTLDPAFLADALNMANFARFLAYLPDDLVTDSTLNEQSQHGALLLRIAGTVDRDPDQPAGMSLEAYDLGLAGLDFGLLYGTTSSLAEALQEGWLLDLPQSPIFLGHRRMVLNPALREVGFGYVDGWAVMQAWDTSRVEAVDYSSVAWPSAEAFPVEFFPAGTSWCLSLNPSLYNAPTDGAITVTLTRVANSQSWTLNAGDNTYSAAGEYFDVDPTSYGIAHCIIFRPDSTAVYADGEQYRVQVGGLSPKAGGVTTLEYETRFFSLP
jgi:hypothetical protein